MASTVRIKRRISGNAGAPSTLKNAELAYNEVDNTLYYGKGDLGDGSASSVIAIGGEGVFATIDYVDTSITNADLGAYAKKADNNTFDVGFTNTFNGTVNLAGVLQISGTQVTATAAELNYLDGVIPGTAVAGLAVVLDSNKDINLGTGDITCAAVTTTGDIIVGGNLTVEGTLTTIDSVTVTVADKNLELASTESPTNTTADGGGITIKAGPVDGDKILHWVLATGAWTSNQDFDLTTGHAYHIAGTEVLSATALGAGVTSSSLTSVGTITSGAWQSTTAIAVAYGGTGATTAETARQNLGLVIGTNVQAYSATLQSVADETYAGDDSITTVGEITTGTWSANVIAIERGGTGANNITTARQNLGLVIGADVQAHDEELDAIAGLISAADRLPYFTGSGTAALATFTTFGRDLVDDDNATTARGTLGLGSMATQNSNAVEITGGTIDNVCLDGGTF